VKDLRAKFFADISYTRQQIKKALDEAEQWFTTRFDEAEQTIGAQAATLMKIVSETTEVDMTQKMEVVNRKVKEMINALLQYRKGVTETAKMSEENATTVERRAKEAADVLM
jgi:hypothetical protein